MGKEMKKQVQIKNDPLLSKKLRIAENNALVARKRKEKLYAVLEQELKGKDPSTAAVLSEVFGKEITQVQNQITKYFEQCMELNIRISKRQNALQQRQGKKQKHKLKQVPPAIVASELPADAAMDEQPETVKRKKLSRQLRKRLRARFEEIWRSMKSKGQTKKRPKFPNDMQIPAADMDKCLAFWANLFGPWMELEKEIEAFNKEQSKPVTKAEHIAPMANGIITKVYSSTSGCLFAKNFGTVHIPSEAFMPHVSFVKNLRKKMKLRVGGRVLFSADLVPTDGCRWTASQVVLVRSRQGPVIELPDVIEHQTGLVTEISEDGSYALIESPEHGVVFCPSSALCAATDKTCIPRIDQVLGVGAGVRFSAHVHPRNTRGLDWLAFVAKRLRHWYWPYSLLPKPNAIAGKKLVKEDEHDSVETSEVVFHKRCAKKRKAPTLIEISDDDVIPKKRIKKEPEDSVADSLSAEHAPRKVTADKKFKKEQEPEDYLPSPNTQSPHNRPTIPDTNKWLPIRKHS